MRPDIASNLQQLHDRLGSDLDHALTPEATSLRAFADPPVDKGLELRQVAGFHAGGVVPIAIGSHRFGERSGSAKLSPGVPTIPRFGLTLDPSGRLTVFPTAEGVIVDGRPVTEPTVVGAGQIIHAGTARFLVGSEVRALHHRFDRDHAPASEPMPTPTRGWAVDDQIVEWAERRCRLIAVQRRLDAPGPSDIRHRCLDPEAAIMNEGRDHPCLGRVAVAYGDGVMALPEDTAACNSATLARLEELTVVPSIPIEVDLLRQSVAIVGHRTATRAVAAWMVLYLVAATRPEALEVDLHVRSNPNRWTWAHGLPRSDGDRNDPDRLTVTVVDENAPPAEVSSRSAVILVDAGHRLPDGIGVVIDIGNNTTLTDRSDGTTQSGLTPIGVSALFALEVLLQLKERIAIAGRS